MFTIKISDSRRAGVKEGRIIVTANGKEIFDRPFSWVSWKDGQLPQDIAATLLLVFAKYGGQIEYIGGRCEVRERHGVKQVWWIS